MSDWTDTFLFLCFRQTDMLPKTRLGKRSPLGALVSSSCPTVQETRDTSRGEGHPALKVRWFCQRATSTLSEPRQCSLSVFWYTFILEYGQKTTVSFLHRRNLTWLTGASAYHSEPWLSSLSQVYFQCGGAGEPSGVVDQLDLVQSDVSAWPSSHPSSSSSSCSRSVSSCIDVPRRSDVLTVLQ